ncbi:MAG: BRO family protein [Negativibacillus sp.]|nr:BRO family protein [Negativibacillus sp.]
MNDLQIFNSPEFGAIRTIEKDGEPWFVGKDVAAALGYSNTKDALSRHIDAEDKYQGEGVAFPDPHGILQYPTIINESGLYSLVLSSKLPGAKQFKRWVTSEVIPSIRKHGAYMTPETLEAAILNPDTMIRLCTALKDEQDKRKALEVANAELVVEKQIMQPKADYFDELVDRNLLTSFRETAKQLEVKEKELIGFLFEKKYIYRDKKGKLQPYADKNNGLFEVKECFNEKTKWSGTQTLVTPKGRETFRLLWMREVR